MDKQTRKGLQLKEIMEFKILKERYIGMEVYLSIQKNYYMEV